MANPRWGGAADTSWCLEIVPIMQEFKEVEVRMFVC